MHIRFFMTWTLNKSCLSLLGKAIVYSLVPFQEIVCETCLANLRWWENRRKEEEFGIPIICKEHKDNAKVS